MSDRCLHHSILEQIDCDSVLNKAVRHGDEGTALLIRGLIADYKWVLNELQRVTDENEKLRSQIINHPPSFSFDTTHMPICD